MKLELSPKTLEKSLSIKFGENPSSVSRVVLCGRTNRWKERHDGANSCFSQFCERA